MLSVKRCQRTVPGFTVQSMQKNTKVSKPPDTGCQHARVPSSTVFRKFYQRGDFPLMVQHGSRGNKISWKTELQNMDYHYYLPLFFDGLCETTYPYCFLAKQGIYDLLQNGGSKVLPVLPQLIGPIRNALNTKNHQVVITTLQVVQKLVTCVEGFGKALVPYYRQILPVLNLFKNRNLNTGDGIDYGQMKKESLGDLIQETLEILELHGGDDAYFHLKYMIPTYESCINKSLRIEFQ